MFNKLKAVGKKLLYGTVAVAGALLPVAAFADTGFGSGMILPVNMTSNFTTAITSYFYTTVVNTFSSLR